MTAKPSLASIETQILELLDEHFEGYENPHITILKICALLSYKREMAAEAASERIH